MIAQMPQMKDVINERSILIPYLSFSKGGRSGRGPNKGDAKMAVLSLIDLDAAILGAALFRQECRKLLEIRLTLRNFGAYIINTMSSALNSKYYSLSNLSLEVLLRI